MFVSNLRKIVSLVKCDSYERNHVQESVIQSINLLGGIESYIRPGQKILVKPNLLRASPIERAVTTHPEVVRAVCKSLLDRKCEVIIGESPGGGTPFTKRSLRKSYREAGLDTVAKDLGIKLNFDLSYKSLPAPKSKIIKRFLIMKPALDADAIVSVSKLKTHLFTYMTGATKNTFGVIPGMEKATFHSRLQNPDDFSEMLVDLNELVRPKLHVMDAVVGMEGNGPNSGKTRKVNAILASDSYSALDVVACRLMSIPPLDVGVIKAAIGRGLLKPDLSDVGIVGEVLEDMIVRDFKKPKSYLKTEKPQSAVWKALGRMSRAYAPRPALKKEKCPGLLECGDCFKMCPQKAIIPKAGWPSVDYGQCIRCYCCHEICPNDAIKLERSLSGKMMKGLVDRPSKEST